MFNEKNVEASTQVHEMLHEAFGPVLLAAKEANIKPLELVTGLISFAARSVSFGHADVARRLIFSEKDAREDSEIYGKIFAAEIEKSLLRLKEVIQ